jgi:hypothetical protein
MNNKEKKLFRQTWVMLKIRVALKKVLAARIFTQTKGFGTFSVEQDYEGTRKSYKISLGGRAGTILSANIEPV